MLTRGPVIQTSKRPRRYYDRLHEVSREWQSGHVRVDGRTIPVCRRRGDILWWPQLAIVRTALGTSQTKSSFPPSVTIGHNIVAGDTLFLVIAGDSLGSFTSEYFTNATTSGGLLTRDVVSANAGNVEVAIFRLSDPPASIDFQAHLTFNSTSGQSLTMAALRVSGLATSPFDKSSVGTGTGTSPSSGATAPLAQADEICIGAVGTEGPVEDAAGTWSNSFNAGQRDGTTGGGAASNITVSEGYLIVAATTAQTAAKTSITSRDWAAAIATYKGADAAFPPFPRPQQQGLGPVLAQ